MHKYAKTCFKANEVIGNEEVNKKNGLNYELLNKLR